MSKSIIEPQLKNISNKNKSSRVQKQTIVKSERDKIVDMIESFYDKAKTKIQKTLNKDNKRTSFLCKELFSTLNLHPKQQLYEISKLSDILFNEIGKINNAISDFLKCIQPLGCKINTQLNIQKEKAIVKQERQQAGDYHIALLRKINFKKQKTSLSLKLKEIQTFNKKLVKFYAKTNDQQQGCSIEIDDKKLQTSIVKYKKIWFSCKKREYLLCLTSKKENQHQGQLILYSDKLQTITSFNHLPPINLLSLVDIVQIQQYIFIAHSHSIVRINLTNEDDQMSYMSSQRINKIQTLQDNLIIWVSNRHVNHSALFMNLQLQLYYQQYLRLSVKQISYHFKLTNQQNQETLYFITRSQNGTFDLMKMKGVKIQVLIEDVGVIDQIIPFRIQNRIQYVLFRKGGQFYKFCWLNVSKKLLQIDMENGQTMRKCCILGEHLYALNQSGKYLLQCHLKLQQDLQNPEP